MKSHTATPDPLPPLPDTWPVGLLNPQEAATRALLANIQGNLLKGHGRKEACLLVFRLRAGARVPDGTFWSGVRGRVTSGWLQYNQARQKLDDPHSVFTSFALSAAGVVAFQRCFANDEALENDKQRFGAFNAGMREDFWCKPELAQTTWDKKTYGREGVAIHGLWLLACDNRAELKRAARRIQGFGRRHGIEILWTEKMTTWKHKRKNREAFGFVDGVSVPAFFRKDAAKHRLGGRWMHIPLTQVLIANDISAEHAGGSFLVLRKLEQKVKTFRAYEAKLRGHLARRGLPRSQAAALLVGRYRNGEPLVGWPKGKLPRGVRPFNHFDHEADPDGFKCPFHAHIRKMNPRSRFAATNGGLTKETILLTQLVRRGMVYDPQATLSRRRWTDTGVGLMFMAYTSDIRDTFSRMQGNWSVNDLLPHEAGGSGRDPLLASPTDPWNWRKNELPAIPPLIQPKGGEYFYVPSLRWLEAGARLPSA